MASLHSLGFRLGLVPFRQQLLSLGAIFGYSRKIGCKFGILAVGSSVPFSAMISQPELKMELNIATPSEDTNGESL